MVLLVIPCYNEEKRLRPKAFISFVQQNPDCHILFVNDGSRDDTQIVIESMQQRNHRQLHLLSYERNEGKAEAVRRGILHGLDDCPEFIGYWDADLSTPLEALESFLATFRKRPAAQVILGSRLMSLGRLIVRKRIRHYGGRVLAAMISIVTGLHVYDSQCGAKLFRVGDQLKQVFSTPFLSKWLFDVEVLIRWMQVNSIRPERIEKVNAIFYELPLAEWIDITGTKIRWRDAVMAPVELVRIWFGYRTLS